MMHRLTSPPHARGWVPGESEHVYRGAAGVNASVLKLLATKTPAHVRHELAYPSPPTPAMLKGTAIHAVLLEGRQVVAMPEFSGKGSLAQRREWLAERASLVAENAIYVTEVEARDFDGMRASLATHAEAAAAIEQGLVETSGYARSEELGLTFKVRPDVLLPATGVIYDLKTCVDASAEAFQASAWRLGYHIQAAWYLAVANLIAPGKYQAFRFIAIEKEPPYALAVYEASPAFLEAGSGEVDRALGILLRCLESGEWFGFPPDVTSLEPPRWARSFNSTETP